MTSRSLRRIASAWLTLLALMLTSFTSAYLPLGPWNAAIGIAIAALKSLIVLLVFMDLVRAPAVLRLAAAAGFAVLALLFTLSGVDFATRAAQPAAVQPAQQLQTQETLRP